MSRLEHDLERDLRQIADRATPSPDAWASIQQRIADQDPIQETEIIMLMENTTLRRRWPLVAAAAAVLALVVAGIALIVRDDGAELPADVPPTAPEPAVEPEPEAVEPETVGSQLPAEGAPAPPGVYSTDAFGVPAAFEVPDVESAWTVLVNNQEAVVLGYDTETFVAIKRIGSFYDADEARDPSITGLGSIPPDDIDLWLELNGLIVDERNDVTVGGRDAKYRRFSVPAEAGDEACPGGTSPCLNIVSSSADQQDFNPGPTGLGGEQPNSVWIIELGEFEPLGIWAFTSDVDHEAWLDDVEQLVESFVLGEPAPAVEGGTARLPERITVTGDMTVTQTGERNASEPWPVERVGPIVGDINGTHSGTGISSPNGAEVTMDWVMDVTIDGLGSGTLTLRSHEIWTGDAARTAIDVVLGGTGDFEGVTGYGSTVHTDDGSTFTTDIELHLTRPTG